MELEKELHYFETIKAELLKHNQGQFALIHGETLAGTFTKAEEAYEAGIGKFGDVPFLIKEVIEKEPVQAIPALTTGAMGARS